MPALWQAVLSHLPQPRRLAIRHRDAYLRYTPSHPALHPAVNFAV